MNGASINSWLVSDGPRRPEGFLGPALSHVAGEEHGQGEEGAFGFAFHSKFRRTDAQIMELACHVSSGA